MKRQAVSTHHKKSNFPYCILNADTSTHKNNSNETKYYTSILVYLSNKNVMDGTLTGIITASFHQHKVWKTMIIWQKQYVY